MGDCPPKYVCGLGTGGGLKGAKGFESPDWEELFELGFHAR